MRLPSGHSLREAKVRHLEVGPLHKSPERGLFFKSLLTEPFKNPPLQLAPDKDAHLYSVLGKTAEFLLLSNTAKGFIEYTSPPVDFTSIMALHEKHFTGPE